MKSNVHRIIALALCASSLIAVSSASDASPSEAPKPVSFKYASPGALDSPLPKISTIAVCAADQLTLSGTYDPVMIVEKIGTMPGLKAISPRTIAKSIKDSDMSGTSASERQEIMAEIARATNADAVLYVKQNGNIIVGGKGGLIKAKRTFEIKVTVEIYVTATQQVLSQDISTFVAQGASMLGVQKISEHDIREAFASDLIARIVPSGVTRVASY